MIRPTPLRAGDALAPVCHRARKGSCAAGNVSVAVAGAGAHWSKNEIASSISFGFTFSHNKTKHLLDIFYFALNPVITQVFAWLDLRAKGAPFDRAEVQVSLRSRVARLILVVPGQPKYPAKGFPLDFLAEGETDYQYAAAHVIEAARIAGLLSENSTIGVVDVDSMPAQA